MNNLLENTFSCDLMVWETSLKFRNKNNIIKFYTDEEKNIQIGDVIVGNYSKEYFSSYEILQIENSRIGNVKNKTYWTVVVKWSNKRVDFDKYNLDVSYSFRGEFDLTIE